MKSNKKMSASRTRLTMKMSARVPTWLYIKAKFVAASQGMTMEEKVTELLRKDVQHVSSQKWFQELFQQEDMQDFDSFGGSQAKRDLRDKGGDSGASDFDANHVIDDEH